MEFNLENSGQNIIQSYQPGCITINTTAYTHSLLIAAELLSAWQPQSFAEIKHEHFKKIIELKPKIFLLGTGERLHFPEPALLAELYQRQIGVEVMDTPAACRTYNVLTSEGRHVVAALLIKS